MGELHIFMFGISICVIVSFLFISGFAENMLLLYITSYKTGIENEKKLSVL
jgi:hypothetical protein